MNEITEDMIDFHILEWGVEIGGNLYMDGCSDAEFGECDICNVLAQREADFDRSIPRPRTATK